MNVIFEHLSKYYDVITVHEKNVGWVTRIGFQK